MAQLIFLNERSHPAANLHRQVADQSLTQLVDVMLRIKRILPQASLISSEPLPTLQLGDNYSVALWLNGSGANRERGRFLLGLSQQAPFRAVREQHGDPDPGVTIYRHAGQVVDGLGLADLYGGLPISFSHDVQWHAAALSLDVERLLEEAEEKWSIEVRHASLVEHVDLHRNWLASLRRRSVENAADLLAHGRELFPHVEFGPKVESDLNSLESTAFLQVVQYLYRLNDSVEDWDEIRPTPQYPPGTNDESATRKPLCVFPAPGGGQAAFTWHGKYTPGAGRIHFRLERHPKRVVIGYIGGKLGI